MRLEAQKISFRYDRRLPWIFEDLDFSMNNQERVGIFAPSGYGKSTLAMVLAGYYAPAGGQVLLDGAPMGKGGRCPVQLIGQHPERAVNPRWRMRKVLEESGAVNDALLADFGIVPEWLERSPRELSGGELQRFCVARALMSGPNFLICDEISTMLDAMTQAQIWAQILTAARRRELGLIVVTHNKSLAKQVCTKIFDMENREYITL